MRNVITFMGPFYLHGTFLKSNGMILKIISSISRLEKLKSLLLAFNMEESLMRLIGCPSPFFVNMKKTSSIVCLEGKTTFKEI
jgi:hypothetical protein